MRTPTNPTRLLTALALAAFALAGAGCSGDDDPTAPVPEPYSITSREGDLQITVTTDQASYEFGEAVTMTVTLANTGDAALDLDFDDRYNDMLLNVISEETDYSHYAGGEGTRGQTTLAAGASLTNTFVWHQTIRPSRQPSERGFYEVYGRIFFEDGSDLRARGLYIQLK